MHVLKNTLKKSKNKYVLQALYYKTLGYYVIVQNI